MSNKGITLSPKHGVNPSMDICFWCGQPKGILLCGHIHQKKGDRTDVEAPKEMVVNLEPCDKCNEVFKQGVRIVEVIDDGSKFGNNLMFSIKSEGNKVKWPTGRWVLMRAESVKGGKAGGMMLCDPNTMDAIFEKNSKKKDGDKKTDDGMDKEEVVEHENQS